VVLAGAREPGGWWGAARPAQWADAIEAIRRVAAAVGVPVEVRGGSYAPWHPGRCAEILLGGEVVGHAGELHPAVCKSFGVPVRTAVAELDLDALLERSVDITPAPEFSTYPVAKEDVALVVAADVPAAAVGETLREGAGELLESLRLFDVYTGEQIGEGKKSLAFALRFRAPDRTLTESETAAARDAAVALAVERHGAVHRA
jgi:phenylalanyl-tRNA synthetase beta chain